MFNSTNPFGQPSSNPFGSQSGFPQISNGSTNPFAPKPFASTSPFGSQAGTSIFGGTSTGVFGAPQATSPFSSTTTFGASSSPAFANTLSAFGASSTPAFGSSSSAFGGSSVFGQKPVFGGFGSTPTQTSPFGSTGQQSQPAFGSSLFGSSSPFGATTQSPFGSTSTPAFGSTSIPGFGATSTPAFGSTSTPVFGSTSSPAFGAASTPAFGSTSTLPFGSTGSAFGASSAPAFGSGGAFGASNSPVFGSPSTSAFGASTSAFGGSSSPTFGASSTPSFSFGSSAAFGQSTSAFGSNVFGSSSTPFGTQSSAFGSQSTTPTFGSTTFGQPAFGSQRGGTRIAAYTPTTEPDSGSGSQGAGKLESISAMPIYKDKCHEELRWEDYQLGDKGGPLPAGQSTAPVGFNASTPSQPNLLTPTFGQAPATFGQTPANPFSTPTTSNPFAPKPSAFGTTSAFSFSSSAFAPSTSSNIFGSAVSPSTASFISTSAAPFGTSPSFFNSSSTPAFGSQPAFGSTTTAGNMPSFGSNINFGNTQPSSLFPSTTPSLGQTGSAFRPSTSAFGQSTNSFGQSSLFNQPSSVFGGNLFSSAPSLIPSSTPAFGQSSSNFSTPFQPAQTQPVGAFGFGNFGQAQPGGTSGVGGTAGVFGQNGFGQLSTNHASVVAQPPPITNPFGTLPAIPQMTIGRAGNASSIQYGISSMPVVDKPSPLKISSLLTSRPLSQRRIRLSARKYHPKSDGLKVPFFSEDEETPSTPKADALFIPRENPRALVIRPTEHWPAKASAEKASLTKNTSGLHVNGKYTEETSLQSDSMRHENGNSAKDGPIKEPDQHNIVNQKTNGFHEHNNNQKGETYKTLSGHRAGEAAIAYEHGADIEALMPKLRHADYYTQPKIQELAAKERAEPGFCRHVKDFVVGRHGFGSIKFMGETDVRRIDLESLVQFNNREVIVYMDDSKKPPVGQGLNKPAEVTLLNIKCFDKKTGRQYTEGTKVEKYKEMLKRKAEDQGAEFVSYDPVKGEWKFKVNHFSKYNLEDEDEFGELQ